VKSHRGRESREKEDGRERRGHDASLLLHYPLGRLLLARVFSILPAAVRLFQAEPVHELVLKPYTVQTRFLESSIQITGA